MRGRADLARTAGNVLLTPIGLADVPGADGWERALLAGSADAAKIEQAVTSLREAAPRVSADVLSGKPGAGRGLKAIRKSRYDVVCLMLTGEGGRHEKVLALLSGAPVVLGFGQPDRWYLVRLPALHPASPRWWARLALAGVLCALHLAVMMVIQASDALWQLAPVPPPVPDPGPPTGHKTTFIVPTYNQRRLMDSCLPPLLTEAGREHVVMVVDDAGTDGTAEYVRQRYPGVRVVKLAQNRGFAGAVRAGIAASDTPLFALINSDVQVRPGYLQAILRHFSESDTFAVCSRIEMPGESQVETGKAAGEFSGILEPYYVAADAPGPTLYASGACSVFHRARYEALGGMETMYRPLYWEDTELGYRAWRRGWRSLFEPAASAYHQRRAWIGSHFGDPYADETFLRNALLFVWKNVRDTSLLSQHVAYVWARLAREVLAGESMMCRALVRALPLLPRVVRKRWSARRRGDLGDREILGIAWLGTAVRGEKAGQACES
jgi:GT2 family glycosyltransferase